MLKLFQCLIISILVTNTQNIFAQLCGYDFYNLFIIDIHRVNENKQAKNIEVYLCGPDSTEINKIVPNAERRIGLKKEFPRAQDYYVTLISNRVKPGETPPTYFAKIIDGNSISFHRLFYEKSLNICFNNPESDHPVYKDRVMIQEDGNNFSPIEIVLSEKQKKPEVSYPLEQLIYRYHFKEDDDNKLLKPSSTLTVDYVDIIDYYSMNKVGKLMPSAEYTFQNKYRYLYIQETDVFHDNPGTIKDIIIITNVVNFDHQLWNEVYRDYFIFDAKNQNYRRDENLSSTPNVYVNTEGVLSKTSYEIKGKYLITNHFAFKDNTWVIIKIEEREIYLPENSKRYEYSKITEDPADCLCSVGPASVLLPVLVSSDSIGKYEAVKHKFILENKCKSKIDINVLGEHTKNFLTPTSIGPYERIEVEFESEDFIIPESVLKFEKMASISSNRGQFLNLTVTYFLAGAKTEVTSNQPGILKFRNKSDNGLYAYTLRTDLSLMPVEFGDEILSVGDPVGLWCSFNPDGTLKANEIKSKRFIFFIKNSGINLFDFYPEIKKDNQWSKPEYVTLNDGYMFYCDRQTDSIRVIANDLKADYAYNFEESGNNSGGTFYLINENDDYLLQGQSKIPIKYFDHIYLVTWNYGKLQNAGLISEFDFRKHIQKFVNAHPGAGFTEVNAISDHYEIDLTQLSEQSRQLALKKLIEDDYIELLSIRVQLDNQEPTYSQNHISIQFHTREIPSQKLHILQKRGFEEIQVASGTTHVYHAKFQSKILDRSFYDAINQLNREKEIVIVIPSLIYKAELEYVPGDMYKD